MGYKGCSQLLAHLHAHVVSVLCKHMVMFVLFQHFYQINSPLSTRNSYLQSVNAGLGSHMSVFGCHFCVSGQQMPVIADIRCNWQEPWQQYSGNTSTLMMFSCYSLCEVTQFWLGLNGFVSLSRHYWVCIGPLLGMRFLPVSSSIICISCLLLFFLITSEIFS